MSRWGHPRVNRTAPQRSEYEYGDELPIEVGTSDSTETELPLSDSEVQREKRLRRERLARKRPCGFAPWPEDA